jgi:hypothetical protein
MPTTVKFKKEEVTLAERAKSSVRRRLPEVDLIDLRLCPKAIEPILICDAGIEVHRHPTAITLCIANRLVPEWQTSLAPKNPGRIVLKGRRCPVFFRHF